MLFHEVKWIRIAGHKLCPELTNSALEWYRPYKHIPCFFQKFFKSIKQYFRKVPVIVQLGVPHSAPTLNSMASSANCKVQKELPVVNAFSTKVNARSLQTLAQNPNIKKIWYDSEVKAVLDIASPSIQANSLWETSLTGKGVTVAVIDTGIYNHPDIKGRIIGFTDLVSNRTSPYDNNGHGTHVAGDIAGNGSQSNASYRGPAPEANLVGVKVLDRMGSGLLSTFIQGIDWCIQNKDVYNIKVINISLGATASQGYKDDPLCLAVEEAWKAGIVVCAAAGNSGPGEKTIGTPAIDPLILTIGAVDDRYSVTPLDDAIAEFSSRGPTIDGLPKPDVVAPGVNIISLLSPSSFLDKMGSGEKLGTAYMSLSGTSMATPVCAGVVAQLLQADKNLTPTKIKEILMQTATDLGQDQHTQGAGMINAKKALEEVQANNLVLA